MCLSLSLCRNSSFFAGLSEYPNYHYLPRATGDDTRSLCTTVCKWTYLGHAHMQQIKEKDSRDMEACGWDDDFWEEIGLGDLVDGHHAKIGIASFCKFIQVDEFFWKPSIFFPLLKEQ